MNQRLIRSLLGITLFLVIGQFTITLAQQPYQAPEGIPPESDFVYRKHYEEAQAIMQAPLADRAAKMEAYMKALHPKSQILGSMEAYFRQIAAQLKSAGNASASDALTKKLLVMFPNSDAAVSQQLQQAFQAKDYGKSITLGEKLLAKSPDNKTILNILAASYIQSNNEAKAVAIVPKAIKAIGAKDAVSLVIWMADYYKAQNDIPKALTYYKQALGTFSAGSNEYKSLKTAIGTIEGTTAFKAKDFDGSVAAFNEVISVDPGNDGAYLYLGLSYWRLQKLEEAQSAFAKATVLGKGTSAKAREYLLQIYTPLNGGSEEGLDKVLDAAKADLGI
jgi:tetratricopeptide (TPR) repeat protein